MKRSSNPESRVAARSRNLYVEILHSKKKRSRVGDALGANRDAGLAWIDAMPNPEATLHELVQSEDSLHRFSTILEAAPGLVDILLSEPELSQQILDGTIESALGFPELDFDTPPGELAQVLRLTVTRQALKWALDPSTDLADALAASYDGFLRHICGRLCISIDLLALGSYGTRDLTLGSDLDVAVLVRNENLAGDAEIASLLSFVEGVRRQGAPIHLDFGVDSMLRALPRHVPVRTYDGLRQYELEAMGMAERFGLGHARLVWGDREADRLLQKTAYAVPLTPERLRELVAAKRRYENEHVQPKHKSRDIMRGLGGLTDIEWFVHLHEMRFPTATLAGKTVDLDERIRNVAGARLINSVERDELLEARRHLREVRHRLILLGLSRDVVPENPDRLSRLAHLFGYADGNDFLAYHERVTGTVRTIYEDGLERLKV